MLKEGMQIPSFATKDGEEKQWTDEDFRGRKLVLYFYPKDNTSGCTKEAEGFRDYYEEIKALGAEVVGVSQDSINSHKRFSDKLGLPFVLLSDPGLDMMHSFEVWSEKKIYGKTYMGTERTTFLIDENGKILRIWFGVKVKDHAEAVLKALQD